MTNADLSSAAWWASRRRVYNWALLVAGIAAFLAYAAVLGTRCAGVSGVEISLFTMAGQGAGYLLAMAVANLCYSVGSWFEPMFSPAQVPRYRRWAFQLGLAFSVALPFGVPVLVAIRGCR